MTTSRTQAAAPGNPLPLRPLTAVWVALGAVALCIVALVVRGAVTQSQRASKERAPAAAQGPTKRQVRERQEHITLTERALELARKERKAAADAAARAPEAGGSAAPAVAEAASAPRASRESSAAASPAADAAPRKAATPAASGLDEMRADIASQFE